MMTGTSRGPVLVLGASGNVGSALTRRLAGAGVEVRAFYDPSTGQNPCFPAGVHQLAGNFDDAAALSRAMKGVDAVFMLTPPSTSQVRWQQAIADAAHRERVRRIVKLSAFETGDDSALQMGRWHHAGEAAVAASGCEYVFLRPQYFMQMQLLALRSAASTGTYLGAGRPDLKIAMVDVDDIAAVAAVALQTSDYQGQVLVPTGPAALSFNEMATELATVVGRTIRYQQRAVEEIPAQFSARGWPDWHINDYLLIHGDAASDLVTTCVRDVAGTEPTSFLMFLHDHSNELIRPPEDQ